MTQFTKTKFPFILKKEPFGRLSYCQDINKNVMWLFLSLQACGCHFERLYLRIHWYDLFEIFTAHSLKICSVLRKVSFKLHLCKK